MELSPLPSATASAVSGIRDASSKLDTAAASLVSATTGGGSGEDTVSISDAARGSAGGQGPDLPGSVVDLRVAKYQNAAAIKVLQTADEMTRDLMSLGKSR